MIRKVLDLGGYLGIAALALAAALSFGYFPRWAHTRGFFVIGGALLVAAPMLVRIGDYRAFFRARTMRYGLNTAIMILLVLGVTTIVQALSYQHSWRSDLTENKRFSLAPQTIQLLRGLKTDVNALAFYRPEQPGKKVAADLLAQYAKYSNGRFKWEMADLDLVPTLARKYGVESYGTIVLETKIKTEKILDAEEEKLTNGLVKVTREGKRVVYVVQGHGERELSDTERRGFSEAKALMDKANYDVKPLILAREAKIPNNATLLIVPGPRTELLPQELDGLDKYVGGGGKLFLMLDPPFPRRLQYEGLKRFLGKYGVEVGEDLVIEYNPLAQAFGIGPQVPIISEYGDHTITRDMRGVATLFPLTRTVSAAKGPPQGVSVQALARSSAQSWGETNLEALGRGQAERDAQDAPGPVSVAVVAMKDKARLVVWGTSDAAANQWVRMQGNPDFFLNTVSWLAEEEDQISIRPKDARQTPVLLNANQAQLVFLLPVIVVPGLVLAGGVVAVVRRRGAQ